MSDIIIMIDLDHYYRKRCPFAMTETAKEIVEIFSDLSQEGQDRFLMYARIAHTSEQAVRKAVTRALCGEDEQKKNGI